MASLSVDKNGSRIVQFRLPGGTRQTLRLGRVPVKAAETVQRHVEAIVTAMRFGTAVPDGTMAWLETRDVEFLDRLERVGLVMQAGSAANVAALGTFLERFLADRKGATKPGTLVFYGHTVRNLTDCFGADKPLADLTEADADAFRRHLVKAGLSTATVARRCGLAKTFLRTAVKARLIVANPFDDLKGNVRANRDRHAFISREETDAILAKCPDADWRLIVALARYGGVRTPSETLTLKLTDVDWTAGRIRIHSPKTEHHEGGAERFIPLFPELRPYLEECAAVAPNGAEYFIQRYSIADCYDPAVGWKNVNLRSTFTKIVRKAGLTPWPRLFHALRASRQTELVSQFPLHVVCEWLGNSRLIAQEHYLMQTGEDFQKAVASPTGAMPESTTCSALQKALHAGASPGVSEARPVFRDMQKPTESRESVGLRIAGMGGTGFDTTGKSRGKSTKSSVGAAKSAAPADGGLSLIVDAWPQLTDARRARILAIVHEADHEADRQPGVPFRVRRAA